MFSQKRLSIPVCSEPSMLEEERKASDQNIWNQWPRDTVSSARRTEPSSTVLDNVFDNALIHKANLQSPLDSFSRINRNKTGNTKRRQDTVITVAAAPFTIFCPTALCAHYHSKTQCCAVQSAVSCVPLDNTAIVKVRQCNRPSQSADRGTVILPADLHCSPSDTVPYRWRLNLLHHIHIRLWADKQKDNIHNAIFNLCSKSQTCVIKHWRKGQWQVSVTLTVQKHKKKGNQPQFSLLLQFISDPGQIEWETCVYIRITRFGTTRTKWCDARQIPSPVHHTTLQRSTWVTLQTATQDKERRQKKVQHWLDHSITFTPKHISVANKRLFTE